MGDTVGASVDPYCVSVKQEKLWILKTNWSHALRTSSQWASTEWETDVAYFQWIKIFVLAFYTKCN